MPKIGVDLTRQLTDVLPTKRSGSLKLSTAKLVPKNQPAKVDLSDVPMTVMDTDGVGWWQCDCAKEVDFLIAHEQGRKMIGGLPWGVLCHKMVNPFHEWDQAGVNVEVLSYQSDHLLVRCYASAPTDLREDLVKDFTFPYEKFDEAVRASWDWYNNALKWIADRVKECGGNVCISATVEKVRKYNQSQTFRDGAVAVVWCRIDRGTNQRCFCWVPEGVVLPVEGDVVFLDRTPCKNGRKFWDSVTLATNTEG